MSKQIDNKNIQNRIIDIDNDIENCKNKNFLFRGNLNILKNYLEEEEDEDNYSRLVLELKKCIEQLNDNLDKLQNLKLKRKKLLEE